MPDTIIDEPPPPTLRDPVDAPPPKPSPRRRLALLAVLAAVIAIALGGAAIYLFLFRYEAVASRHVPSNANLVVRTRVTELVLWKPVRDRLLPLLIERAARGKSRGDRLRDLTGVNVVTDVRELMIASVDATNWVIIAGGRLERGRFVDGLEQLAREEGWPGVRREGELLVLPGGIAAGQAEDGCLVIASDARLAMNALPTSDEHRRLALPEDGAVTFVVTREAWSGAAGILGLVGATVLDRVQRASGQMSLGDQPVLAMRIEPTPGVGAAALARELSGLIKEARFLTLLLPDIAGEKGALRAAQVKEQGQEVAVTAPWPNDGLDRALDRLATVIRALGSR